MLEVSPDAMSLPADVSGRALTFAVPSGSTPPMSPTAANPFRQFIRTLHLCRSERHITAASDGVFDVAQRQGHVALMLRYALRLVRQQGIDDSPPIVSKL
jgi:hypothetical protein